MRWGNCLNYAKNTDISLDQIYLWRLQENILKYYSLNIFKGITIGFNHGPQMTSESLASLSDGKCLRYLCLQFIFRVGLSFNCAPHIKGVAIWWVREPDVKDEVVAEIFSQPTLGSFACVAWRRVQLLDAGSASSHLINPTPPPLGIWCWV